MVFALLVSAILWNLSTWCFGLPASSSHTLIGSIIGVGVANQLMQGTTEPGRGLVAGREGFPRAADFSHRRVRLCRCVVTLSSSSSRTAALRGAQGRRTAAVLDSRLLVLTCTGVSFFHGSNDGQKGMGLIMLILIGTVPTAYALNHAVGYGQVQDFVAVSEQAAKVMNAHVDSNAVMGDPRADLTEYLRTRNSHAEHDSGGAPDDPRDRTRSAPVQER